MSLTLYRKYRPKKFSELVGQEHIKQALLGGLRRLRITHAYLFCGPKGTGKTTTARILAKAVNCLKPINGEPDDKCQICKEFNQGKSLDLIEIDAASNRGIDQVRDLIGKIQISPTSAKYKVFIIDEVHMLSRDAFGALLKTLEEPPAHSIFILATTDPHKLPPTIISRCQRFDFRRVSDLDLITRLKYIAQKENFDLENGALELISENAEGSFRDAESFLDQIVSYVGKKVKVADIEAILGISDQKAVIELVDFIIQKETKKALKFINKVVEGGYYIDQFNKNLVEYLRKLLIYKVNPELFIKSSWLAYLNQHAIKLSSNQILKMIKIFIETQNKIKEVTITQLPLEMAAINLTAEEEHSSSNIDKEKSTDTNNKIIDKNKKSQATESINEHVPQAKTHKPSSGKYDIKKLDNLLDVWPKILDEMKTKNHSMLLVLRNAIPVELENSRITLGVKFKFHADQIMSEKKNKILIEVLEKILGQNVKIKCKLVGNLNPATIMHIEDKMKKIEKKSEEELYDMAHKIFGT